jgi:hypothetical protein
VTPHASPCVSPWCSQPGTHWAYLTTHLQFAGAMAVAASGMEIDHLFQRYLYTPFNMTSTTWSPRKNPQLAVGITTTANDFEQLLHRLLTYAVLPKAVLDVMETDTSQPPCSPSGDGWFGHYGMGHWWECIGYGTPRKFERQPVRATRRPTAASTDADAAAPPTPDDCVRIARARRPLGCRQLPKVCTDAAIQAGPGMYGYYPLIDRSGGGGQSGPRRASPRLDHAPRSRASSRGLFVAAKSAAQRRVVRALSSPRRAQVLFPNCTAGERGAVGHPRVPAHPHEARRRRHLGWRRPVGRRRQPTPPAPRTGWSHLPPSLAISRAVAALALSLSFSLSLALALSLPSHLPPAAVCRPISTASGHSSRPDPGV